MNFRIDLNRGEKRRIAERSVDLAREDWLQVDFSYTAVIKADPKPIRARHAITLADFRGLLLYA
jgi:hypothetical protein